MQTSTIYVRPRITAPAQRQRRDAPSTVRGTNPGTGAARTILQTYPTRGNFDRATRYMCFGAGPRSQTLAHSPYYVQRGKVINLLHPPNSGSAEFQQPSPPAGRQLPKRSGHAFCTRVQHIRSQLMCKRKAVIVGKGTGPSHRPNHSDQGTRQAIASARSAIPKHNCPSCPGTVAVRTRSLRKPETECTRAPSGPPHPQVRLGRGAGQPIPSSGSSPEHGECPCSFTQMISSQSYLDATRTKHASNMPSLIWVPTRFEIRNERWPSSKVMRDLSAWALHGGASLSLYGLGRGVTIDLAPHWGQLCRIAKVETVAHGALPAMEGADERAEEAPAYSRCALSTGMPSADRPRVLALSQALQIPLADMEPARTLGGCHMGMSRRRPVSGLEAPHVLGQVVSSITRSLGKARPCDFHMRRRARHLN